MQNINQSIVLDNDKIVITTNGIRTVCSVCETNLIKCKQTVKDSIMSQNLNLPYQNGKKIYDNEVEIIQNDNTITLFYKKTYLISNTLV